MLPRAARSVTSIGDCCRYASAPTVNSVAVGLSCEPCLGRSGSWGLVLPFERVIKLFEGPVESPFVSLSALSFPTVFAVGSVESILISRCPPSPPPDIDMTTKSVCGEIVTQPVRSLITIVFVTRCCARAGLANRKSRATTKIWVARRSHSRLF